MPPAQVWPGEPVAHRVLFTGQRPSNLAGSPVEALMILIKHVLVATDFSEPSGAALNYGRELARTFAATLHVLHVADNVTFQYRVEGYSTLLPEMQEDVEASARRQLDALITEEDRVELHAEPVVITAVPKAAAIVHYASGTRWTSS